jgi:hypothetical protein
MAAEPTGGVLGKMEEVASASDATMTVSHPAGGVIAWHNA